jgi:hypothetical protein
MNAPHFTAAIRIRDHKAEHREPFVGLRVDDVISRVALAAQKQSLRGSIPRDHPWIPRGLSPRVPAPRETCLRPPSFRCPVHWWLPVLILVYPWFSKALHMPSGRASSRHRRPQGYDSWPSPVPLADVLQSPDSSWYPSIAH